MPERLWYFVHIPKTAGTTVRHWLHRSFAPGDVLFVYPGELDVASAHVKPFAEVASMGHAEIARYRVLYGHYVFKPEWFVHDRVCGLAFVRDPRARVVSWFHYVASLRPERCTPRQRGQVELIRRGCGLEQLYRRAGGILELDNGIVRYLSGAEDEPAGAIGDAELERAKRHVEEHFDFVGHTRRFDESMRAIAAVLGRAWRPTRARNVSPHGPAERSVSRHDHAFLDEITAVDSALVDWLEARFFAWRRAATDR